MKLFIVLGRSRYPVSNRLFTEKDIANMQRDIPEQFQHYTLIEAEPPWVTTEWSAAGGKGNRAYPEGQETTTMRVPAVHAWEVKQFAVWLARESNRD